MLDTLGMVCLIVFHHVQFVVITLYVGGYLLLKLTKQEILIVKLLVSAKAYKLEGEIQQNHQYFGNNDEFEVIARKEAEKLQVVKDKYLQILDKIDIYLDKM